MSHRSVTLVLMMKLAAMGLVLVLLSSACSRRSEPSPSAVTPNTATGDGKPHFDLVASDLAAPAVISTNGIGQPQDTVVVNFQLSADKAAEFAKFTQAHLGQQVQLICDSNVLAEPYVASPIKDGRVQAAFSSLKQARVIEELLNKSIRLGNHV